MAGASRASGVASSGWWSRAGVLEVGAGALLGSEGGSGLSEAQTSPHIHSCPSLLLPPQVAHLSLCSGSCLCLDFFSHFLLPSPARPSLGTTSSRKFTCSHPPAPSPAQKRIPTLFSLPWAPNCLRNLCFPLCPHRCPAGLLSVPEPLLGSPVVLPPGFSPTVWALVPLGSNLSPLWSLSAGRGRGCCDSGPGR